MKDYYKNNKEKCTESSKKWRLANPERARQSRLDYKKNNKEKTRATNKIYRENNKERLIEKSKLYRLNLYNLTLDEYNLLIQEQQNKCAICRKESSKTLHIDHNHITGKVRGLLCNNCNRALGYLKDDAQILKSAIEYLKETEDAEPKDQVNCAL